jgi:hypothetical protein
LDSLSFSTISMSGSDHEAIVDNFATTIEELLKMGTIRFDESTGDGREKVILTTQYAYVLSKLMVDMDVMKDDQEAVLRAIYLSFLIYLNEYLKLPKRLTMALGNDVEKFQDDSELSRSIKNYVLVLYDIFQKL